MLWSVYWGNQIQPPLYNRSLYIQVPKNSVSSSGFNAMQMLTSSKDKILIHSKSAVSRLKKYILWILKSEFICEENINLWQIVRQEQFKKCTGHLASNAMYVLQGVWEKCILRKNVVIFNPSYNYWALVLLNTFIHTKEKSLFCVTVYCVSFWWYQFWKKWKWCQWWKYVFHVSLSSVFLHFCHQLSDMSDFGFGYTSIGKMKYTAPLS